MTVLFTADHHFNDFSILDDAYQRRKEYECRKEMEEDYINKWNKDVDWDHTVYHLGDFCRGDLNDAAYYFKRLNGKIVILPGNHDMGWYPEVVRSGVTLTSRVGHAVVFIPGLFLYKLGDSRITLFHYPLRQWPHSHKGAWHLHGHSHGKLTPWGRTFDVGVDTSRGYLYSLTDVIKHFEQREQELPSNVSS